jgi:glycosyltransferase involved in cell wall biosynthesis
MRGIDVSVVLATYNDEENIKPTMQSVLSQNGTEFELIVVNDGSTDNTRGAIWEMVSGEASVTVLDNSENQGLTKSLIKGCAQAQGKYIARIDAGDRYLPSRLFKQHGLLESDSAIGLVSCGTRYASAEGEFLYEISQQPPDLAAGLSQTSIENIKGPSHHGSTMFRRDLYEAVGGYRDVFRVAQDLDLWMRMYEQADMLAMPEVLYEARIYPDSISVGRRDMQVQTAELILEGARCRRGGKSEPDYESRFPKQREKTRVSKRKGLSKYDYFVGGCLAQRDRRAAAHYFRRAWHRSPMNLKYGARYLRSLIS